MQTLLLSGAEVARLLPMGTAIEAVEAAFRLLGEGRAAPPAALSVAADGGGFHVKAAILPWSGRRYFVAKTNGNFPGNAMLGLPTIQGLLLLCDAEEGSVLAVMDSMEITAIRTAAATAVAARRMARPGSAAAAVIGCGVQGGYQVRALAAVLPLRRVRAYDVRPERARTFAAALSAELGIPVEPAGSPAAAASGADVVVTCTTAREIVLRRGDVAPGAFVAGVGADSEAKWELDPGLRAHSRLVTDLRDQCARIGDLHHALEARAILLRDVHADLAEVVAGLRTGRESEGEVTVFDSTGLAIQDVAAAAAVFEAAGGEPGPPGFDFAGG